MQKYTPALQEKQRNISVIRMNRMLSIHARNLKLRRQHGCCYICKKPEQVKWRGKRRRLAIDHDHMTGKIRGLLCYRCNLFIGHLENRRTALSKYIDYILKWTPRLSTKHEKGRWIAWMPKNTMTRNQRYIVFILKKSSKSLKRYR